MAASCTVRQRNLGRSSSSTTSATSTSLWAKAPSSRQPRVRSAAATGQSRRRRVTQPANTRTSVV